MPNTTRILLIDDDASDRAAVSAALAGSRMKFALTEATDAASGLQAAASAPFDCVLLDSHLPEVAAADFLTQLTSAEGGRHAVIVLTDGAEPEETLALLRAGALGSLSRQDADAAGIAQTISYAKARQEFVAELQVARDDAEAKSRALDRLNRQTTLILSILAHDLRNPFQVLIGMSQLLVDFANSSSPTAIASRATAIHEAADQAYGLVESLLSWAGLRMDARAEPTVVDVDVLFRDCLAALQERADAKGVRLEMAPSQTSVLAQEDATAAILRNLAANALKFTAAGGAVTLSAAARDDRVVISVVDTGVGMSEGRAATLFQFEKRSTTAGTAGERGAGLGLLLCRDLAEWISGELEVESQLGQGTTFRVVLPGVTKARA